VQQRLVAHAVMYCVLCLLEMRWTFLREGWDRDTIRTI